MPRQHRVSQGECIASIALNDGFFPDTIWDDAANAELKQKRVNPYVLLDGDIVVIPEKREKRLPGQTEARHRFRRKGVPEKLRIRLLDEFDEPRSNLRYILTIEGRSREGETNGDGELIEPIPPNAREGTLVVYPNGDDCGDEISLKLGHIDPISEECGVRERLSNLGLYREGPGGKDQDGLREAVAAFQRDRGLEETGDVDEASRKALEELYGS